MRTVTLQDNFTRMMFRDAARDDLPPGAVWDSIDWLPDVGAALRGRGGWTYWSIAPISGGSYYVAGNYAPFSSGYQVVGILDNGDVIKLGSGVATNMGAARVPYNKPVWWRDLLIITPHFGDGAISVKKYTGAAVADLGGTPPNATLAALWRAYLVLARSDALNTRAWFSGLNNVESWNTVDPGGSWVDFSLPLSGIAPLKDVLLFFQEKQTERLRGDNPPPGGDMKREFAFPVGCSDPRSIAHYQDQVIFANPQGIYITDGANVSSLTYDAGASSYWQQLMVGYVSPLQQGAIGNHIKISGEVYRDHYLVTIMSTNSATLIDCLAFNLTRKTFFRLGNLPGFAWIKAQSGTAEELYLGFGSSFTRRVSRISPIWDPDNSTGVDGDGVQINPRVETPFYQGGHLGPKHWLDLFLGYDVRYSAGSPTLRTEWVTSPESTSYAGNPDSSNLLPETSAYSRDSFRLNEMAQGIAFKIQAGLVNPGDRFDSARLYSIEAQIEALEQSGKF